MIRWLRSLFGRKPAPDPDNIGRWGAKYAEIAPAPRPLSNQEPPFRPPAPSNPIGPDLTSVNLYEVPPAAKPEIIVTGTLTAYFDDPKLYEEFKAGEKALQAAIKEVLLSPWFPGSHRPWEPGWYERMDGDIRRDYWTGSTWTLATRFTSHNVCQDLPWRGLAADPRAREGEAK
jgi:hypothetical protein